MDEVVNYLVIGALMVAYMALIDRPKWAWPMLISIPLGVIAWPYLIARAIKRSSERSVK